MMFRGRRRAVNILKNFAVALGITNVALGPMVHPLFTPGRKLIYHWSGSSLDLFAPLFLDFSIFWLLVTLLLLWVQATESRRFAFWGATLVLFTPALIVQGIAFCFHYWVPSWVDLTLFSGALILGLLLLLFWHPSLQEPFSRIIVLARTVSAFIGISGAILLGQFVWLAWSARALNHPLPMHHSSRAAITASSKPRIIWIILDELSYQQVYGQRFPGLKLPAFDALARQATVFDHVVPAGASTDEVVPSLLTGEPVDQIRSSAEGLLSMHDPDTGAWQRFEQHNTVFQDALNAGYSTGLAGWWNPYCRTLPAVLDHCFWWSNIIAENGLTAGDSVPSNMVELLRALAVAGRLHRVVTPWLRLRQDDAALHTADYKSISAAADQLLRDRSAGFILLHLPIPHPGGIYNRRTGQLSTKGSDYIDNLALADRYVAHVRFLLEQNGQWDSSTIVIMGDHGWRTATIWRDLTGWTQEEERASQGGRFDHRPAYIVKLAGQQEGALIHQPFRAVDTRKLLDALIDGNISSAEMLSDWVRQLIATESRAMDLKAAQRNDENLSPLSAR